MKNIFRNARMHFFRIINPATLLIHGIKIHTHKNLLPKSVRSHLFKGTYEEFECTMVERNLKKGDRVLEIGTGIGLVSLLATRIVGPGNVLSCEANPAMENLIRSNYSLNNQAPNLIMKAVTADGRYLSFHQDPNVLSSSTFGRDLNLNIITVPSISISDLISQHKPNVLIIDVEGSEIELIPAADLSNIQVLIIELHPHIVGETKINALLNDLINQGLKVFKREHKTYLLRREDKK